MTLLSFTISLPPFLSPGWVLVGYHWIDLIRRARMAFRSLIPLIIILWQTDDCHRRPHRGYCLYSPTSRCRFHLGHGAFLNSVSGSYPVWDFSLPLGAVYNNIPVFLYVTIQSYMLGILLLLGSMHVAFVKFALHDICRSVHVTVLHVTHWFHCKMAHASDAVIYDRHGAMSHIRVCVLSSTFCHKKVTM